MKIVVQHELMDERCAPKTPVCVDQFVEELGRLSGKKWDFRRSFGEQTDENRDCVQRCSLQISDLVSFITSMKTFVSSPESAVKSNALAVSESSAVVWGIKSRKLHESSDDDFSDVSSESDIKEATIKTDIRRKLINGLGGNEKDAKGQYARTGITYDDGYNYWYSVEKNGAQDNWFIERGKDFSK